MNGVSVPVKREPSRGGIAKVILLGAPLLVATVFFFVWRGQVNHLANRTVESQIPDKLTDTGLDLNAMVRELEGKVINEALKQTGGNKQAAAKLLGLKRTTFAAKLRRCGVITPSSNGNGPEI